MSMEVVVEGVEGYVLLCIIVIKHEIGTSASAFRNHYTNFNKKCLYSKVTRNMIFNVDIEMILIEFSH